MNLTAVVIALIGALEVSRAAPIAFETWPKAINDLGQIVGFSSDIAGTHGFLDTNGVFTFLDLPGTTDTIAYGINDAGQILLYDNQHSESFLYSAGQLTPINSPSGLWVWVQGINNAGQIVGVYGNGTSSVAFVDTGGIFTTLDAPGSFGTGPGAINDAGQVVGVFSTEPSLGILVESGFLYSGGAIRLSMYPALWRYRVSTMQGRLLEVPAVAGSCIVRDHIQSSLRPAPREAYSPVLTTWGRLSAQLHLVKASWM